MVVLVASATAISLQVTLVSQVQTPGYYLGRGDKELGKGAHQRKILKFVKQLEVQVNKASNTRTQKVIVIPGQTVYDDAMGL